MGRYTFFKSVIEVIEAHLMSFKWIFLNTIKLYLKPV